ncbi:ATP-binding protein [Metabacillus schmidteae]|uniref:ATP-binding protein n=1 Tax=Metabacillus schmidteae TaxID=2730405 RepID=UPI0015891AAB|nr:ATP-binding protein [Metabacillus schmidteae]
MKFKTKLYMSIGSLLLLISIIVVILMGMLENSTVNMNVVVNDLNNRINLATNIKYETANIGRHLRELTAINQSSTSNREVLNAWEESQTNLKQSLEELEDKDTQAKSKELIVKYKTLQESYLTIVQQLLSTQNTDVNSSLWNEAELIRKRMIQIAELLQGLQEQEMKNELLRSRDTYNWAVKNIYIFLAIGLLIGVGYTIWIIKRMTNNLNHVTSVMKSATNSHFDHLPRIEITQKGEIGEIAIAFNKMAIALENHSKLEKKLKEEAEENSWLKTKFAEIATMYPEVENIKMLSERLITKLVPMVGGSLGVFYVKEVKNSDKYLKKMASYALLDENNKFEYFRFGEGLIGQSAAEKRPILLKSIPEHYINVHSGLGKGTPKNIMILPVQFEGNVLAVIEVASFDVFSSSHIKLLEEVSSNIGITINSIMNRMKVDQLLQESQALTEELQAQSEELQVQQEELRTTNEKLEEQYETSEQKKQEVERIREALEEKAQQLEISSQYKSEFLANMSHELRTPLNSLLILAKILSENSDGNLTFKQQEYIRTIFSSGNDLLKLINDILDLAKVESGKLEVIPKEVKLQTIKEFIIGQFSPISRQNNVDFKIQFHADLPEILLTDEQRLHQILKNLLSNAFKFTEHGSILLSVQKVNKESLKQFNIGSNQVTSMIAFSVTDTGIGIDEEKQEVIFEAFKQADGTTSRQYGGTGLGLSISKNIADLLGGFLEVNSKKGKGSTFTLYLPYEEQKNTMIDRSSREEAAVTREENYSMVVNNNGSRDMDHHIEEQGKSLLKGKKILIVDDDIRNVYALTVALEKYELEIVIAENGKEGIEELLNNPDVDLVLMDIMMPEMDGFQAMREIRKIEKFNHIPIIALTAKAMKHSREQCLEVGATDYISKPINLDQLFSLMHVWLYSKEG